MPLNNKLIRNLADIDYALGEIISMNSLDSGHQSDNIKVTTRKGSFVFKYFPQDSASLIESLILQDLLASNGVKLPRPVPTATGELFVELSPTETIVVQSFIPGEAIVERDRDPEKMFSLMPWFGEHLGEFHFRSKSIPESVLRERIPREEFYDLRLSNKWLEEQYSQADSVLPPHKKNAFVLAAFEKYLDEFTALLSSDLTLGIIHTDLKPGDFFVQDNVLSGILDFNGADYSFIMNELGTWLMYTSLYKPEHKSHFQNFIVPYLEHSDLPARELQFASLFLRSRAFVQFFYFAYRIHHNITRGLEEGETNMDGFEDGIYFVESSTKLGSSYFYDLAMERLE